MRIAPSGRPSRRYLTEADKKLPSRTVAKARRVIGVGRKFRCVASAVENMQTRKFLETQSYVPPDWASKLSPVPSERLTLGMLPTPMHPWKLPSLPSDLEVWIKRDDMTGCTLSGNKVRKLEFLLADAKIKGADCVITIGGIQSNHCRATAVASRYLGLDVHLILRTSDRHVDGDPGLIGNLMIDRLSGAHIHQVTKQEYAKMGQRRLVHQLAEELREKGKKPYAIPVGGTNGLGTWGYLECTNELLRQPPSPDCFTDIVVACGSGATVGGLALGIALSRWNVRLHSYGVCDNPEEFNQVVRHLFTEVGAENLLEDRSIQSFFTAKQAKGAGYAISKPEELKLIEEIAQETAVILDPVYSGKAVFGFYEDVKNNPSYWSNKRVLFIHTGGLLGLYEKSEELLPLVQEKKTLRRMPLD